MTPSTLLGPLLLVLAEQTPEPSPTPDEMTIYTVTPGISGFLTFFVLAFVGWLLFRSLTKRIRRVNQEGKRREELAAQAETAEGDEPQADGSVGPGEVPGTRR